MDIVVPALTAVLGFMGGLLAPWIKWKVEERSLRTAQRRQHIKEWRAAINDYEVWNNDFGSTSEYSTLRAHMRPEAIAEFEAVNKFHVPGGRGEDVRKHMLLDEIAHIEKEWGLV